MSTSSGTTVISLGGSLVVPDDIDVEFVKRFVAFVRHRVVDEGERFIVVVGGGGLARQYQNAAHTAGQSNADTLDWIGIHATHFNARFIRALLDDIAYPAIVTRPQELKEADAAVVIGAGSTPGHSTDLGTVELAVSEGVTEVINLSNARYVYNADPSEHSHAEPYERISWEDYISLIPYEWKPGLNTPFDPVASRYAYERNMRVVIAGGDIDELEKYMQTGEIDGTIIQ